MFRRGETDPEVDRTSVDLHGRYSDVDVHIRDVAVSRRRSGAAKLADPDATVAWLDAAQVQLSVHRSPRRGSACAACSAALPTAPSSWSSGPIAVPGERTGTIAVTTPAQVCPACGAAHVHGVRQFFSDYCDAIIDGMETAGIER